MTQDNALLWGISALAVVLVGDGISVFSVMEARHDCPLNHTEETKIPDAQKQDASLRSPSRRPLQVLLIHPCRFRSWLLKVPDQPSPWLFRLLEAKFLAFRTLRQRRGGNGAGGGNRTRRGRGLEPVRERDTRPVNKRSSDCLPEALLKMPRNHNSPIRPADRTGSLQLICVMENIFTVSYLL
mgnify:CR=1 FL=1